MNVVLMAKSYVGNPHVRFEEEEVASTKPRRGSLRCKDVGWLGKSLAAFLCIASIHSLFGAWYDSPVVKAQVDIGHAGNYAYYINQSEDGRYLMVNTQSGNDNFPVQLYATADLNGAVGAASGLALGEAFGKDLFGTGGNGWKGGAISAKLGVMIPGSGAPTSGSAVYTALEVPATRWTANVNAFAVTGLGTASVDGMDFNPSGTKLYCNNKDPQNRILAYPVTDGHTFGTPAEFTVAAATRIRNLSVYSIGGKELVYFGEGNVGSGAKAVYVLDPATGLATALVTDATRFASNIMNVKLSGADTSAPKLYVQTESSGLFVYELAADGKSVLSATPVAEFTAAQVAAFCGSSVTCSVASFEVSPDGRFAYFLGLSQPGFASPSLTVISDAMIAFSAKSYFVDTRQPIVALSDSSELDTNPSGLLIFIR